MGTDAVTLLFALLAVGAQLAVVIGLGLIVAAPTWPAAARYRDQLVALVGPQALGLGLLVATVATVASLYLSEIAHFIPCRLCWYQRAAMYPLVPILALAVRREGFDAVRSGRSRSLGPRLFLVALALAVVGGCIAAYHMLVERFPSLEAGTCDPSNPCSLIWVRHFGYLTIPTMAFSAFALIAILLVAHKRSSHGHSQDASPTVSQSSEVA